MSGRTGVQGGRVDGFKRYHGDVQSAVDVLIGDYGDPTERRTMHEAAVREAEETTRVVVHHPERKATPAEVLGLDTAAQRESGPEPDRQRWETPNEYFARIAREADHA